MGAAPWQAYIGLSCSILGNGTFTTLHKLCTCANEVWVLYYSVGFAVGACLTIPFLLIPMDYTVQLAPWGLLAGVIQLAIVELLFPLVALLGLGLGACVLNFSIISMSLLSSAASFPLRAYTPMVSRK